MKCAYKHCLHESVIIEKGEEVKVGSRYMHKDCAVLHATISEIENLYIKKVSSTVVMKNLRAVINNIVFTKNVDAKFLLFALKYAISNHYVLKAPASLCYLIDDYKIKKAWLDKKAMKIVLEDRYVEVRPTEDYKYTPAHMRGIVELFGEANERS